jgi:hypothetical protein
VGCGPERADCAVAVRQDVDGRAGAGVQMVCDSRDIGVLAFDGVGSVVPARGATPSVHRSRLEVLTQASPERGPPFCCGHATVDEQQR